jgi:hypothetical protein
MPELEIVNPQDRMTDEQLQAHIAAGGNPDGTEHKQVSPGSPLDLMIKDFLPDDNKKEDVGEESIPPSIPPAPITPTPGEELGQKLEEMDAPTLIEEVKKHSKIASEFDVKYKELTKQYEELKKTQITDTDAIKALKDLSTDFAGNYQKIQKQFGLPELDLVVTQLTTGDPTARVKQWQESTLTPQIEKEFKLAPGEFEYNANEASKAGTPSYRWDELTATKRSELHNETQTLRNTETQRLEKINAQQATDKKWFADTYFEGKEDEVKNIIAQMDEVAGKVSMGQESAEKHPFSMRNILKGFLHESLMTKALENQRNSIAKEYAEKGIYLPTDKPLPGDLTKIKGTPPSKEDIETLSKNAQNSPMIRDMMTTLGY